jgi:molecular chaperone GrpE
MLLKEIEPELGPEAIPDRGVSEEALQETAPAAEPEAAAGSLVREIEKLAIELEQKTREAEEANDKYRRTYADFENYRKRMQRDQADFRKYANEQMAFELLTVLDHLGLALNASKPKEQGLQQVWRWCTSSSAMCWRSSVSRFQAEGECFDPAKHEAMMQVETSDVPENMVVQVFQDGYLYHEKILRHAKVGVSKKPPTSESVPAETRAEDDKEDQQICNAESD